MNRVMAPKVLDYYIENSYGQLKDISFHTLGSDIGPKAQPIKLPRDHLADYFYPDWVPAKLLLTRSSVALGDLIVFDGRETMQIDIQPDGGLPLVTLDVSFAALVFDQEHNLFPIVHFGTNDKLELNVETPSGLALFPLTLYFTEKTIDIEDNEHLAARLSELEKYLDDIFKAAETSAGLTTRLFAKPVARRLYKKGFGFGRLLITVAGAVTFGPKLVVHSASATLAGSSDPLGMKAAIVGAMIATSTTPIEKYINVMLDLAEHEKGFDENTRQLDEATVSFDGASGILTTTIPISKIAGGPTASLDLIASSPPFSIELYNSYSTEPNSATTYNMRQAMRDMGAFCNDVFTAATQLLLDKNYDPKVELAGWQVDEKAGWHAAMIFPVEPAVFKSGDLDSVQSWETWNVTPLYRPFEFRGIESMLTAVYTKDSNIQLQAAWTLDFFGVKGDTYADKPDISTICHELGHGLGFRDLYWAEGYREDLAYLRNWAIMDDDDPMPHHSGYHKLEAQWIPDFEDKDKGIVNRVKVIPPNESDVPVSTEVLMIPIELWNNDYVNDARAAFGVGSDMDVVQLVRLDLGGDGAVFDLIEARQVGKHFSHNLPSGSLPGLIITNALEPWDDTRYKFNDKYRRELHLLNPSTSLTNPGDSFDLANAPGLPAKGIVVSVINRKMVGDANVFHVKIDRVNGPFVDLYFSDNDPIYANTDLWIDWIGDNPTTKPEDHHDYPLGEPTDQGEMVHLPPDFTDETEPHWIVARLRNRGQVNAEHVKLEFQMCVPAGGGDSSGNFTPLKTVEISDMPGNDVPMSTTMRWDVPSDFPGHTCFQVVIKDYKIPKDSSGAALASDDVWVANNRAQKNVTSVWPFHTFSPYEPVEFEYSVHNEASREEYAYLEPDGLAYGMKLTVTPHGQVVPPKSTVIFRCKLELDDKVLDAGCGSDRQFRLITWRRDPESSTKWGGVQYKVRPRKKCVVTLKGYWDYSDGIKIDGLINPDPGGGVVRLRLAFEGKDLVWIPLTLSAGGFFTWEGSSPGGSTRLGAVASFEGTAVYGPATSSPLILKRPPPIT
jgi:hypothetical protein